MSIVGRKRVLRRLATSPARWWAGAVLACGLVGLLPAASRAQLPSSVGEIHLPLDRRDARGIQRAQTLIAQGETTEAIRFLDQVLARSEDSFVYDSQGSLLGMKELARQMLRDLPPEGLTLYETTYGPPAGRLLQQAVAAGDAPLLRQITQQYFYTPAGYQAALLYAQQETDQGRHLAAALLYQQLLDTPAAAQRYQPQLSVLAATSWLAADAPEQASQVLAALASQGYRSFQLAGQTHPLPSPSQEVIAWLLAAVGQPLHLDALSERLWLTFRGNAARNGQTEGGLPHLRPRWQVRLLEDHDLEQVHDKMAAGLSRQQQSTWSTATPLAVGNYILTRGVRGLLAVDLKSGKRVWRSPPEQTELLQGLIDTAQQQSDQSSEIAAVQKFARLLWSDYLHSSTSSDGERVYMIRDLELPQTVSRRRVGIRGISEQQAEGATNRLCAYELKTEGKLVWEIDGAARTDPLPGAFFLGAPVQVGQRLYGLVELQGEAAIYLVALDRASGALEWRQQLAGLEVGIANQWERRLQASTPSYDQGMLVCSTNAGVVVGVDLAKRSLAWAYRYDSVGQLSPGEQLLRGETGVGRQRWLLSAPVLAEGRVLLAPPESNDLYCLDLQTGKLLWKQPRGEALFLAGVSEGRVLLVGARKLSALALADGQPAWTPVELPVGSTPSGSGFFSGSRYFLPLSSAQVVAVELSTGQLVAQARAREGQHLGNLISYRGTVLSQTGASLDCYQQMDVLRSESEQKLAADPTDFEALCTLGEIVYHEGQLERAVELLSQAHRSNRDDFRTREVLGEVLVLALEQEFARYQTWLPLLAEVQPNTSAARLVRLRLEAEGLLELGQPEAAFAVCLEAFALVAGADVELSLGVHHQVDARRWLASQLATVWQAADPSQQAELTTQVLPLLEASADSGGFSPAVLYEVFGALPPADPFGLRLAQDLLAQQERLAAQQLLLRLCESNTLEVRRAAIALSSQLLHQAGQPFLAISYDRLLQSELAELPCLAGKTGAECLAAWATAEQRPDWPYGQVTCKLEEMKAIASRGMSTGHTGIHLERCDDLLGEANLTLLGRSTGSTRPLWVRDSLGRTFYQGQIELDALMHTAGNLFGLSRGNLLIVSLGSQLMAFDTLSEDPQPLWVKSTSLRLPYLQQHDFHDPEQFEGAHSAHFHRRGRRLGLLGSLSHESCVFQQEDRLVCVDPHSGRQRWSQGDFPVGCELWGDDQVVFALPRGQQTPWVLSAVDGRRLDVVAPRLPARSECLTTVGRQMISWQKQSDRRLRLASTDALDGQVRWEATFDRNARLDLAQNRFAVVLEPQGRCQVIDLRSGRYLVDQVVQAQPALEEVYLLMGTDSLVVAVQAQQTIDRTRMVTSFNRIDFPRNSNFAAQIYHFDRHTGQPIWEHPAEVAGLPLMLAQPVDLPIVAFAGNVRRRDQRGARPELGVLLLEKASGRLLYHQEDLPQSPRHFFLQAADNQQTVLEMYARKLTLHFTGLPRPPEPPARQGLQPERGASAKGLQKLGQKLFGGG